jgi:hypothetical protein
MRSCPDIRFIPFTVTQFGALDLRPRHGNSERGGQSSKQVAASICMNARGQVVGLLAPQDFSRRPCHPHGQRLGRNVRRQGGRCGGRFFLARMPCPATVFFTSAMRRKRLRVSSRGARGAPSHLHVLRFQRRVGLSRVIKCFLC